jgi:hypothetical protein
VSWLSEARAFLESSRASDGGWGYRQGGQPGAEPTAFAVLARRALGLRARAGTAWLAKAQQEDGSVSIQPERPKPTWPTAQAVLAWLADDSQPDAVKRATAYLTARIGKHWDRKLTPQVAHDTNIPGWPWVAGTHSWIEPTCYAVCALRVAQTGEERAASGRALLLNRVIKGGGWNYGNNNVLGADLNPFPAPTGLVLVTLLPGNKDHPAVLASIEYLAKAAKQIRSPNSLAWALLGLHATGRPPSDADERLESSYRRMKKRGLRTLDVALLVLAAHPEVSLKFFGAERSQ